MIQVHEQIDHHTTVLTLTGRFDQHATVGIKALILGAKEQGCQHVILDFSGISGIDSVGLGELFLWHHQMKRQNLHISIVNPSSHIQEALDRAHISDLVPIFTSQEEAIKHHEASSS
jgi:anti-sigma B factor antagonist